MIDVAQKGNYISHYQNGAIKEDYNIVNGVITDFYKSYYDNGNLKAHIKFNKNDNYGDVLVNFENGKLQYSLVKNIENSGFLYTGYFQNGNINKVIGVDEFLISRHGIYKRFYENGNMEISGRYYTDQKVGPWNEFYNNGSKKSEIEYTKESDFYPYPVPIACFDENNEPLLKDGKGKCIYQDNLRFYCLFDNDGSDYDQILILDDNKIIDVQYSIEER